MHKTIETIKNNLWQQNYPPGNAYSIAHVETNDIIVKVGESVTIQCDIYKQTVNVNWVGTHTISILCYCIIKLYLNYQHYTHTYTYIHTYTHTHIYMNTFHIGIL